MNMELIWKERRILYSREWECWFRYVSSCKNWINDWRNWDIIENVVGHNICGENKGCKLSYYIKY